MHASSNLSIIWVCYLQETYLFYYIVPVQLICTLFLDDQTEQPCLVTWSAIWRFSRRPKLFWATVIRFVAGFFIRSETILKHIKTLKGQLRPIQVIGDTLVVGSPNNTREGKCLPKYHITFFAFFVKNFPFWTIFLKKAGLFWGLK